MGEIIPRPQPVSAMTFDGERFTTSFGGQTAIEHWHRYLFAREFVRDLDVLDVACGEGYGSALLAQTARAVTGVDLSAAAVTHAQSSYATTNLRYIESSALELPLENNSVDIVVSFETLEHFREHDRFLAEVKRVLRPRGLLLISTPDRDNYSPSATPANPFHQLELTNNEFKALLARHFASMKTLGQRVLLGSALLSAGVDDKAALCFERRGEGHFEISSGMARAKYIVALAGDGTLPALPDSIYIDTDQLCYVDGPTLERFVAGQPPPQAAARITELEAHAGDLEGALRQRDKDVARLSEELAVARQDVQRLTDALGAANADRQLLAEELGAAQAERQKLAGELAAAQQDRQKRAAEIEAAGQEQERLIHEIGRLRSLLDAIYASTSWKISRPVRWLSGLLRARRLRGDRAEAE